MRNQRQRAPISGGLPDTSSTVVHWRRLSFLVELGGIEFPKILALTLILDSTCETRANQDLFNGGNRTGVRITSELL